MSLQKLSVGEMVSGVIARSGTCSSTNCPWSTFPSGNYLRGTFRTAKVHRGNVRRGNVSRGTDLEPNFHVYKKKDHLRIFS